MQAFLTAAGLRNRSFTIPEFIDGLRRAGFSLYCETIRPEGSIQAGVIQCGKVSVLFYPDPADVGSFAALLALAHEAGHLWLGHNLHDAEQRSGTASHSDAQEEEADLFARMIVQEQIHFSGVYRRSLGVAYFTSLAQT